MRYSMSINVNYGNMKLDLGDDYKMAINRYNKVKKDFASIPCEMSFIDEESHKPLFVKVNKQNSFDILYKQLIEILTEMSKLQTNLTKKDIASVLYKYYLDKGNKKININTANAL